MHDGKQYYVLRSHGPTLYIRERKFLIVEQFLIKHQTTTVKNATSNDGMTHANPSSRTQPNHKMCWKHTNDGNGDKNRKIDKVSDAGADAAALALSSDVHFNHRSSVFALWVLWVMGACGGLADAHVDADVAWHVCPAGSKDHGISISQSENTTMSNLLLNLTASLD